MMPAIYYLLNKIGSVSLSASICVKHAIGITIGMTIAAPLLCGINYYADKLCYVDKKLKNN